MNSTMRNRYSRITSTRGVRILDSQTRARYQNQREAIQLRRELININIKHSDTMSRMSFNQQEVKAKMVELEHEIKQRQLDKKLDDRICQTRRSSMNESDCSNNSESSTSESSSLLLHNFNASTQWEKSFILPNIHDELFTKTKPLSTFDEFQLRYSSKLDPTSSNSNLFEQSELFNLSLKQLTERMKKSTRMAVAKSIRDFNMNTRRAVYNY